MDYDKVDNTKIECHHTGHKWDSGIVSSETRANYRPLFLQVQTTFERHFEAFKGAHGFCTKSQLKGLDYAYFV